MRSISKIFWTRQVGKMEGIKIVRGEMVIGFLLLIASLILYLISNPYAYNILIIGLLISAFTRGYFWAYAKEKNRMLRKTKKILEGCESIEEARKEFKKYITIKEKEQRKLNEFGNG